MVGIIIIIVVFLFVFSLVTNYSFELTIILTLLALVLLFGIPMFIEKRKEDKNREESSMKLKEGGISNLSAKRRFWKLELYTDADKYGFLNLNNGNTWVHKMGAYSYDVDVTTGFSESIDRDNTFKLAATSVFSGVGVVLNDLSDDNCIKKIYITAKSNVTNETLTMCIYEGEMEVNDSNISELKQLICCITGLNSSIK